MNNYKSATTAGLLGIFLGVVGAHNWYLGDKKKGTLHVILAASGFILMVFAGLILPEVLPWRFVFRMGWLFVLLNGAGWLLMAGSELWGFIEGIQILTQGDAGLAQKGYAVAPVINNMNQMNNVNMGNTNQMNQMNDNGQMSMGNNTSLGQMSGVPSMNNGQSGDQRVGQNQSNQ